MTEFADSHDVARRSAAVLWSGDAASRGAGIEIIEIGPGRAVMAMNVRDDMINGHGSCHGGFIFLLADSAFGYACNAHGQNAVAHHCSITYVAPGRRGARLVATADERQRGPRSSITDVTVRDDSGAIIAELRGHSRTVRGSLLDRNDNTQQEIPR